jgi:hypothetical protein
MSDSTDLGIIILLIIGLLLYVLYVRKLIDSKYDINSIRCNPINLFLKSINADMQESTYNFAQCVKLFTPDTTDTDTTTKDTTTKDTTTKDTTTS